MCGFLAVFQEEPRVSFEAARRGLDSVVHRGPDAGGEWTEDAVFLGHRRLSIIDLATGDQPMRSTDGRYVVVFNGEIYNYREIRRVLIEHGATFATRSDTEVILEGFRYWGRDVVRHIEGMFAFVIWDRLQRRVFAARDRLGIKPLCWAAAPRALVIGSTVEPFRRIEGFGGIDLEAVRDLVTFDYVAAPRTIFRGVRKLEPGCRLEWESGGEEPVIDRYWSPPPADQTSVPPDEWELEELLDRAVQRQMISDVPIGAFLSGGIDSSLLVALMARRSARPVRTFSMAFGDGTPDESPIESLVARQYGTEHTVLRAEALNAEALLSLLGRLDEPFCDPAFVPACALSQLTRQHVTVALSGDGGDEVFGGYPKYLLGLRERGSRPLYGLVDRTLRVLPWRPRRLAGLYERLLSSQDRIRFAWARHGDFPIFGKDIRQLLARDCQSAAAVDACFETWERRAVRYGTRFDTDVLMRADLETYLSENCLVKTDRASMLASLEVRVPYLDEMVVDRVVPLPVRMKIGAGQLKALLMPIAKRLLPAEVWNRPKQGFGGSLDHWLAGSWRPAVEAALAWGESNLPIFDYGYLRRLHTINLSRRGTGRALWNPFVVLAWARTHGVTG
jgi:asparagine synthase (glutamine-hydrolysing)